MKIDSASGEAEPDRPRLVGIQYLRGIAALQVALYHASLFAGQPIGLGGFGVPLFFVISGFIMVLITDEASRPRPFLRDRFLRVAPLYWLATTAAVAIAAGIGTLDLEHAAASYVFLPWDRSGAELHFLPVLGVGWTLNYEMFFYSVFALALMLPTRARLPFLTLVFTALVLLGFSVRPAPAPAAFWTQPVILQFLVGVWLAHWWSRGSSFLYPIIGCLIAFLLFISPPLAYFQKALWGCLCGAGGVLAVLALERSGRLQRPLPVLLHLGDASYSIYLWHVLAVLAFSVAASRLQLPSWTLLPLGFCAGVASGLLAYRFIEKPLLRLFRLRRYRHAIAVPAGP